MAEHQTDKIREIIESFDTALLVTHGGEREFHARPMALAKVEADCDVWFFTGRGTAKVNEIANDQQVLIAFQDEDGRYVSLYGTAQLVADHAKAREFWKEPLKRWFPKGADDPELLLIYVRAEEAEYWDNQGANGIKYVFEAAKSRQGGSVALHA